MMERVRSATRARTVKSDAFFWEPPVKLQIGDLPAQPQQLGPLDLTQTALAGLDAAALALKSWIHGPTVEGDPQVLTRASDPWL